MASGGGGATVVIGARLSRSLHEMVAIDFGGVDFDDRTTTCDDVAP